MSRGKKANVIPSVQWSIMIPADLAFKVEVRLLDPVTRRVTYAARAKLIQALLHEWLEKNAGPSVPVPLDTSGGAG